MSKTIGIRTGILAQMAGVSEAELVHALQTTGEILGVRIPSPLPQKPNAKTRNFDYFEAKSFADKVTAIRAAAMHNKAGKKRFTP
ncbi:TPA: hypothetical protein ACIVGF_002897 [Salmonella enterica subsp. enterica serovar 16:l,v:-]|nr:hypothetical protein [Salmonella enterica]